MIVGENPDGSDVPIDLIRFSKRTTNVLLGVGVKLQPDYAGS